MGPAWVLLAAVVALAGCQSGGHPGSAHGSASPQSTGSPTTSAGEEDDVAGPGAPTVSGSVVPAGAGSASGAAGCRTGTPLANVYHPNRLAVVNGCMTVSGTVESVRSESDGDTHFDLNVDPPFSNLLKPANFSGQHGWLVAEIVPADEPGCTPGQPPRPATGSYDYGICTGADEPTPSVGEHVFVTGPYVLDEDHGGWAEIHPVWAWSTGAPAGAAPPSTSSAAGPPPSAASGVRIVSVTSPVKRGSTASLVAQTAPGAACDLEVTLPSGYRSQSQGLGPATAGSNGQVQWSWRTGSTTTPGTATATVTCGAASASAQFEITS